jgi:hypothetical protein
MASDKDRPSAPLRAASRAAIDAGRRASTLALDARDPVLRSAARARRAETALVSNYLRALRTLGDVPRRASGRIPGLESMRRLP